MACPPSNSYRGGIKEPHNPHDYVGARMRTFSTPHTGADTASTLRAIETPIGYKIADYFVCKGQELKGETCSAWDETEPGIAEPWQTRVASAALKETQRGTNKAILKTIKASQSLYFSLFNSWPTWRYASHRGASGPCRRTRSTQHFMFPKKCPMSRKPLNVDAE